MTYKAKITFRDLQDNEYIYQVGEVYPREGYEPSKERVAEVLEKGGIEPVEPSKELTVKELKAKLDEAGIEYDAKSKKSRFRRTSKGCGGGLK